VTERDWSGRAHESVAGVQVVRLPRRTTSYVARVSADGLTIERRGRVMVLHLDDGKANALSFELIAALRAAIGAAEVDDAVGAVVIHGREGRFSGGFDLGVMYGDDFGRIIDLVADGGALVRALYGAGVPVVAACTGHAVAAGALVLLGCDVRVGADVPVKIGLNEVAIKMVLPDWGFTIASDRLSKRHLQRATANARMTAPREAVDVGFLDEVVPAGELLERAVAIATELADTLDPAAYVRTVEKLRGATLATMDAQIAADRAAGEAL
jgi:enoyl-CoA hydratase